MTQVFSSYILERYAFALRAWWPLHSLYPFLSTRGQHGHPERHICNPRPHHRRGYQRRHQKGREGSWFWADPRRRAGGTGGPERLAMGTMPQWPLRWDFGSGGCLPGNLAGTLLPFAAQKFGIDPAVISGPLITTVVDVLGLLVYFEVARLVLGFA